MVVPKRLQILMDNESQTSWEHRGGRQRMGGNGRVFGDPPGKGPSGCSWNQMSSPTDDGGSRDMML